MSEPQVSIVMTGRNRTPLLERTLASFCLWQTFTVGIHELVFVDDQSDDPAELRRVLNEFTPYLRRVTLVHMDKKLSKIPVVYNNPALGMNLAVKAAENEIILKTDPEGLQLTETVRFAQMAFDPKIIWFAKLRLLTAKETEKFSIEQLQHTHPAVICEQKFAQMPDLWYISERHRLPYWFGAIFSRTMYMKIGGIDEEFLRGFAGEDDDLAERLERAGVAWKWSDQFSVLHQHHGDENKKWIHSDAHQVNINRLNESRRKATIVTNVGHDWGSDDTVLAREVLVGKNQWRGRKHA